MISKIRYLLFLIILLLSLPEKSLANDQPSSRLICAVDVLDFQDQVKGQEGKSEKRFKVQKKKNKGKSWWKKNKKKVLGVLFGGSLLGFAFRRKKRRRKAAKGATGGEGGGGILITLLLLAGLIWLLLEVGFSVKMILLMLGIAILVLGIVIGGFILAFKYA